MASPAHARPARLPSTLRLTLIGMTAVALLGLTGSATLPADQVSAVSLASAQDAPVLPALAQLDVAHVPLLRPTAPPRAGRSRRLPGRPVVRPAIRPVARKVVRHVTPPARVRIAHWERPSVAGIVSPYGPRWGGFHRGLDFGAGYGAPIHVVGDGVVIDSGYLSGESGYGQITLVRHSDGFVTAYAHQSRSFVHPGQQVKAGEVIGLVGSTGHSTGPHLHFEVRTAEHGGQINPAPWLRAHGVSV